jgi:RNA polymerase sigma-70 factor (ECF subfamily)
MNGTTTATEMLSGAFESIFEQYHQMVYRAAYRVLGNRQDAEDVQQHVFLRLIRKGPDRIANAKSYLYRSATNEALCVVRYRGLREVADTDLEDAVDPVTELSDGEIRGPLLEAIGSLKPGALQILNLQQEGYDQSEIAQMLGKSRNSIALQTFRTRRRLQKLIGKKTGSKK